ncbi:peptide ABC transporter substrate-binding protein [Paracoccus sp. Z330]|uniref:Peptide ABC transporter substrate-binding protein n=1 Tax=Paracoccus onchidii TaxID=3017813 RepID=A0ABT4ZAQ2_9RHOB|nr:peptide ABC transporter substrate-binding protein [Paracoccus onchidii]MDB6176443.1 peptide ABC transporter substrate-binding protein [Paracoccus onchidii]
MTPKTLLLGAAASIALAPAAMAERGSDGDLKIIYWQAPSTMNPYLSSGTKDAEASSLVLEGLAGFNEKGEVIPRLAVEIPSIDNGGISEDLKTVTWKIREDARWSDGTPVTSADAKFTADYCLHPEGGCAQAARYQGIASVDTPDDRTVIVNYTEPRPNPFTAFTGATSPILQKAQFENCVGTAASTCTEENFNPIGTGAFKVVEFKTNDVVTLEANPEYRDPVKPAFATVTLKGGGDATAAARAVLETGEFDYAWNLQLAPDVLASMETAGRGQLVTGFGTLVERIEMNLTNPSSDLPDDERSTPSHPHPILSDERVRRALSMAIDRELLTEIGYGQAGRATCNLVPAPELFASDNTSCLTQDVEGAKALLDEAGWTMGGDGIREKDGMKLSLLFQTSVNAVRQDFQALIKQWWSEIGVETELKTVDPSVFFGGDAGSPDTFQRFYADVEMYANNFDGTDPEPYLAQYTCDKIPGPDDQWQGENINRFCDESYDAKLVELGKTGDIEQRAALARAMNDMLTKDSMVIVPLVDRGRVSAHANDLGGVLLNTWDSEIWNAADWYRISQ